LDRNPVFLNAIACAILRSTTAARVLLPFVPLRTTIALSISVATAKTAPFSHMRYRIRMASCSNPSLSVVILGVKTNHSFSCLRKQTNLERYQSGDCPIDEKRRQPKGHHGGVPPCEFDAE
jgi:hypothetical protein